jgi:hypothetical protein
MVSKKELIVATTDLYTLVVKGINICDRASDKNFPDAPQEHYDELARASVTYVKLDPSPERAVEVLVDLLPLRACLKLSC